MRDNSFKSQQAQKSSYQSYYLSGGLNDHNRGARKIVSMKATSFDLMHLSRFGSSVRVFRIMQQKQHFVILAPPANKGRFDSGHNVAKATNCTDVLWVDAGRVVSASMEKVRPINNA